jgi:hypothetical protein
MKDTFIRWEGDSILGHAHINTGQERLDLVAKIINENFRGGNPDTCTAPLSMLYTFMLNTSMDILLQLYTSTQNVHKP